ncbi:MAG: Kazal-type serine protease inhibitor [Patescibacteria group bacterium]|mgnify:CR=1 FL=1
MSIRNLFFVGYVIILVCVASQAHAQLINGKPTIHVPSNRLSEARDLLMQNPEAAAALKSGALQISNDLGKYSALDYLGGKPVPSRLDYPNPNNPKGYDSVSGQDNIKNKLEELNRGLQDKSIPKAQQPPQQPPKQEDQVVCIPPRPGQDVQNGPITDEKLPGDPTRDIEPPIIESELNYQLRKLGSATTAEEVKRAMSQPVESGKVKLAATPDGAQSQEFVTSLGGNPAAQGTYTINGVKVQAGKKYKVGEPDPETGITFDKDCKPIQGPIADPGKTNPGGAAPGFGDLGNGGGGGGFGGGGGGGLGGLGGGAGGALGQLLPLLMQGLMGGGQGQGQNQYGAGYGNQQQNCAAQPIAPVCGMDGKTYNNSCYVNQQGVILRNTGVCVQDVNSIVTLTQLSQSGIPATLLENVRNLVTSVLSGILAGTGVTETTVR